MERSGHGGDSTGVVAHQTEPEVEEVERLLAESGKTVEDLQHDCERLTRRLGYKDALERLPALHKERAQLDAQIAAADRVLEEAEAAHDEATRPLYERRGEVDRAIREANDAEAKLITECEDTELRRELEDVDAELMRLSTDRRDLLDQASHLEKQALAGQDRAERQLDPGHTRQYREKAAQLEKDAAARRRDAQRVEKTHDELAKRQLGVSEGRLGRPRETHSTPLPKQVRFGGFVHRAASNV